MATIWDDKNHSSGEQFSLSTRASAGAKKSFAGIKFPVVKIDEKEFNKSKDREVILIPENHRPKNNDVIFYFKDAKKCYQARGAHNLNNGNFIWTAAGTSTNRAKMTEIKETCSLLVMLAEKNTKKAHANDEELIKAVKPFIKDISDYWKPVYYTSAIAHSNHFSDMGFKAGEYLGERQQDNFTKIVYKIAKKLTGKAADNWNPADVWFMRAANKGKITKALKDFDKEISSSVLDKDQLALKYKNMLDTMLYNGDLIGVSLKQVDRGNGNCDLVTYNNVKKKATDMDFTVTECYVRTPKHGLPAYGELRTKGGFNIKWGGRANAQKASMNLEGQMAGATHQLGAIESKAIDKIAKQKGIKVFKDSDFSISKPDEMVKLLGHSIELVKKHQQNIYNEFFKGLTPETAYSKYGFVETKRFIANMSVWELVNALNESEIIDCFLLAKKIDKINPDYYILH